MWNNNKKKPFDIPGDLESRRGVSCIHPLFGTAPENTKQIIDPTKTLQRKPTLGRLRPQRLSYAAKTTKTMIKTG